MMQKQRHVHWLLPVCICLLSLLALLLATPPSLTSAPAPDASVIPEGAQKSLVARVIVSNQQEITLIGPNSEISYIAAIALDCSPPFKFKATWEDDSGEPGEYETTLTL